MTTLPSLKILVCIHYYLPHRTGMQLYVQRLCEELARRGHRITILTAKHQPSLKSAETINGVHVIRLWPLPFNISRGMLLPGFPLAAWKLLRRHDVVSVHTPAWEAAVVALLARLLSKPVTLTHHGDLVLPPGSLNRLIERGMFSLFRWAAGGASRIVAYSDDYLSHSVYLAPFREKVEVIPPPIRMPEPDHSEVRALRREWSPQGGPLIGYAGRFVQEKRPDVLIRALEIVLRSFPDAKIVFAGQHQIPYENTWELSRPLIERNRERLIFLGRLESSRAMANFLGACDVLVLPSDSECFGIVQVEAMLCGTPVVATDIPGARVAVGCTGMGRLAVKGDSRSIGEAVVEVLRNPDSHRRGRKIIEEAFSFDHTVGRYEQIFRQRESGGV